MRSSFGSVLDRGGLGWSVLDRGGLGRGGLGCSVAVGRAVVRGFVWR